MEITLYSILSLILEIIFLTIRLIFYVFGRLYRLLIVPDSEKPVDDDIILITGTGHGMGRELAKQYAALGATVVCVDINKENNEETLKIIKDKGYTKIHSYTCDVSNENEIQKLKETVKKEVGIVTVLVNNAGIMPCKKILAYKSEEIIKMFEINVFAHFWTLKAFLPDMFERKRGHIVALSSIAGLAGTENLVPYSASKFAVRGMLEALKEELRYSRQSGIQITTVYPYMVNTGLCHKPIIRFPSILSLVPPEEAARQIIQAMRRNVDELTIPKFLLYTESYCRLLPLRAAQALKDFLGSSLDEHDN